MAIKEYGYNYLIANFKRKLRNTLASSDDIVTIISPTEDARFDIDQILLGGTYEVYNSSTGKNEKVVLQAYIPDFYYVPDTIVENKLFICIESFVDTITDNIMSEFFIDVWVFTQKTNVILTEYTVPKSSEVNTLGYMGNRIDVACAMIENLFKGSEKYGLGIIRANPRSFITVGSPTTEYYGKKMRFTVNGYVPLESGDVCGN